MKCFLIYFTNPEHLTAFGLINMNGRVYDPVMSSFLSVDQYVQSPENAQGFNRYAYCMNNPLRYTDPSGWRCIGGIVGYTPNSADYGRDPYAYADSRGWEPRDLGYRQLPANDPAVTWMEENKLCGGNGANGGETTEPSSKSNEEDPPKGVKVHSGKKLLFKAYWHYQFGGGEDYWIDASTIDLDYISIKDLKELDDGSYWINLFDYSKTDQTALSLGKIVLIPVGDNQYEIKYDPYDFNIEWDQGWSNRNIGTLISGYLHGPVIDNIPIQTHWMGGKPCYAQPSVYFGGPFEFHFSKSVYIKP